MKLMNVKKSINQCVHIKIDEIGVVAFVKKIIFYVSNLW